MLNQNSGYKQELVQRLGSMGYPDEKLFSVREQKNLWFADPENTSIGYPDEKFLPFGSGKTGGGGGSYCPGEQDLSGDVAPLALNASPNTGEIIANISSSDQSEIEALDFDLQVTNSLECVLCVTYENTF
jgi:hypothetical protein